MNKNFRLLGAVAAAFFAANVAMAQVPQMINYQGRVMVGGVPFTGTGYFKFALVDATKAVSYWSSDGTWILPAGAAVYMPSSPLPVTVDKGLYSVMLGNPLPAPPPPYVAMGPVPASTFQNSIVYLRVWFSETAAGPFTLQAPDLRVTSVGYAMNAETVVDGAITELKLSDKAVTSAKLADDAITTAAIKNGEVTAQKLAYHSITEDRLADDSVNGRVLRDNSVSGNELADAVSLGDRDNVGELKIWSGSTTTPSITLAGEDKSLSFSKDGTEVLRLDAGSYGGRLTIYDNSHNSKANLETSSSGISKLTLERGKIALNQSDADAGISLDGDSSGAGLIQVSDASGAPVIKIDGQASDGFGRITTPVLEITGGSDLSENFDVNSPDSKPQPGAVVCIDSERAGELIISNKAYDPTVAGVMSGAGGVKPGMMMGQPGTRANGKHPVALTGRVYCLTDTSNGPIQPGDLLTSSNLPGHAMKATDPLRRQGAIIGKAMTGLAEGTGLVLILVSLQ